MAGYFDSVRQAPLLGYEEEVKRRGQLDEIMGGLAPAFQGVSPEQAPVVQQAGFIPGAIEGEYITPERGIAQYQNQRILGMQDRMREQYERTLNSPIFRVGDTLADVGRLFLSPLIFLKGEDMSNYDPSGKVRSGYRERFEQLESLRVQNVQKFLESRDARQSNYMNMVKTMREAAAPLSSEMKQVQDFARLTNQMELFTSGDPLKIRSLQDQMAVQRGDAVPLATGRIVPKPIFDKVDQYATDFYRNIAGYRAAYESYSRLMSALSYEGGVSDIASIFAFMKSLDPQSVVREGEFNVAASAGGVWDKVAIIEDKFKKGTMVPEEVKKQMAQIATDLMNSYSQSYEDIRNTYTGRAKYIGFDSDEDINALFGVPLTLPSAPNRGIFGSNAAPDMNVPVPENSAVPNPFNNY